MQHYLMEGDQIEWFGRLGVLRELKLMKTEEPPARVICGITVENHDGSRTEQIVFPDELLRLADNQPLFGPPRGGDYSIIAKLPLPKPVSVFINSEGCLEHPPHPKTVAVYPEGTIFSVLTMTGDDKRFCLTPEGYFTDALELAVFNLHGGRGAPWNGK